MKVVTASNGKKILKISKQEWTNLGKTAGFNGLNLIPSSDNILLRISKMSIYKEFHV